MKKRVLRCFIVLPIFLFAFSMLFSINSEAASISKKRTTLVTKQSVQLKVKGTSKKAKWKSTNNKIATVNKKGKVIAKKKGTCKIYAKIGKKKYICVVKVESPKLNKTKLALNKGKTYVLKLNGNTQKIKWRSTNKKVAVVSSKGKVKALKSGKCNVYAKIGTKKYVCSVKVVTPQNTVKPKPPTQQKPEAPQLGSRENPRSGYTAFVTDMYDFGDCIGRFRIQLLDYKDGQDALNLVMKNGYTDMPSETQEYIYFKFKIDYISGNEQVSASDIFNYHSNIFNSERNYKINNIGWAHGYDDVEDIDDVSLYPGGSAVCSTAILIKKGHTPVTYRLETGYDEKIGDIYTWFKTK